MKKTILLIASAFTINAFAQVPTYVPTSGLKGWYPFSGNANDISGNNYNGTPNNNGPIMTTDRFGNQNSAYLFDGINDTIKTTYIQQNITSFSISAWFKTSLGGPIVAGDHLSKCITLDVNKMPYSGISTGKISIRADGPATAVGQMSNNTYLDNNWHHVVGVYTGSTGSITSGQFKIYVDNLLVTSSAMTTGSANAPLNNTLPVIFGAHPVWSQAAIFNGSLDDIGMWNRALTQTEITQLYTGCTLTAAITPQSATTFCQGDSVSLNANTGTNYTYQWYKNGTAISNATSSSYSATQGGSYTVKIDSSGCSGISSAVAVTVNALPSNTVSKSGDTTFCSGGSVTLTAQGSGTYLWSNGSTLKAITVTQADSFSVTVTSNGCSNTSQPVVVTVNQTPVASITASGTTTFCAGGFVTLTANGGGTYQWNSGVTASSINATKGGNYSVIVTANGCTATASQSVTVNANPTVTLASLSNYINVNASPVTLTGNPTGGTFAGKGVSGSSFTPKNAGLGTKQISYSYTDGNTCSGSAFTTTIVNDTIGCTTYDTVTVKDTVHITIKDTVTTRITVKDTITTHIAVTDTLIINAVLTGIAPPNNINMLKVFPNPTNDKLFINTGNYAVMNNYTIKITNALSQVVFTSKVTQQEFVIDLNTLGNKGVYFFELYDGNNSKIEARKIILQ